MNADEQVTGMNGPESVAELRTIEWELNEIIRRLSTLSVRVRELEQGRTGMREAEETGGVL